MQRINIEFLKLGLRGVTLVFPSGDKGVASDVESDDVCDKSRPEFPVSSPVRTRDSTQERREVEQRRSRFGSMNVLCVFVAVCAVCGCDANVCRQFLSESVFSQLCPLSRLLFVLVGGGRERVCGRHGR
jgi:hypothetical protein